MIQCGYGLKKIIMLLCVVPIWLYSRTFRGECKRHSIIKIAIKIFVSDCLRLKVGTYIVYIWHCEYIVPNLYIRTLYIENIFHIGSKLSDIYILCLTIKVSLSHVPTI